MATTLHRFPRRRRAAALLALGIAALLGGCAEGKPRFLTDAMAPSGSTPEQIRVFCTTLGDEAADWNFVSRDPLGPSLRARDQTYAACMARHNQKA
jgi:hypothetical protein